MDKSDRQARVNRKDTERKEPDTKARVLNGLIFVKLESRATRLV